MMNSFFGATLDFAMVAQTGHGWKGHFKKKRCGERSRWKIVQSFHLYSISLYPSIYLSIHLHLCRNVFVILAYPFLFFLFCEQHFPTRNTWPTKRMGCIEREREVGSEGIIEKIKRERD